MMGQERGCPPSTDSAISPLSRRRAREIDDARLDESQLVRLSSSKPIARLGQIMPRHRSGVGLSLSILQPAIEGAKVIMTNDATSRGAVHTIARLKPIGELRASRIRWYSVACLVSC